MRISDWSSDVCSSDLSPGGLIVFERLLFVAALLLASRAAEARPQEPLQPLKDRYCHTVTAATDPIVAPAPSRFTCGGERSDGRRGGKGWVSTCRSRGSPFLLKTTIITTCIILY